MRSFVPVLMVLVSLYPSSTRVSQWLPARPAYPIFRLPIKIAPDLPRFAGSEKNGQDGRAVRVSVLRLSTRPFCAPHQRPKFCVLEHRERGRVRDRWLQVWLSLGPRSNSEHVNVH